MINQLINKNICKIFAAVIWVLLSIYAFSPISNLGFARPDDHWMLLKNEFVHPGSYNIQYLKIIFSRISNIQYSPLNTLYYSLVYKINGFDPYYFHLFNFLFHLSNTLLVFTLTKKILIQFNIKNQLLIAYWTAVIWCIHPLNVETVTWISGSKIILCTFFTFLSFNFFINAISQGKSRCYIYSFITFILSCFIKEQAIITPFMYALTMLCYYLNNKKKVELNKWISTFFVCMFLSSFALCIFTLEVNRVSSDYKPIINYPFFQRLLLIFYCLCFYLGNAIIPINLHYHYPFPFEPNQNLPIGLYFLAIILIILFIYFSVKIYRSKKRNFYMLFIGIFILQISLELQIIPMTRPAIMADRYMYLPLFAIIVLFLHLLFNLLIIITPALTFKKLLLLAPVVYVLTLCIYSHELTGEWAKLNLIK